MKMKGLLLLIAMAVLLVAASVAAADPATESLWSESNSVSTNQSTVSAPPVLPLPIILTLAALISVQVSIPKASTSQLLVILDNGGLPPLG
jgi:hypothetical protein